MTDAQPPDLQAKISIWRQRAVEGTLTLDETRQAIEALRAGRISAAYASEGSRAKKTKAKADIPAADDLLAELGGL
jgi:hypothetical protein